MTMELFNFCLTRNLTGQTSYLSQYRLTTVNFKDFKRTLEYLGCVSQGLLPPPLLKQDYVEAEMDTWFQKSSKKQGQYF